MKKSETFFLVRGLKNGNLSSFEKIYKMYYSKLYGFSKKFHFTTLQPDDFVQQTFLKLWDERVYLSEDILLDKQLYVICKNIILNHLKREKKMVSNQEYQPNLYEISDPLFELTSIEELNKLNASIKKLPKKRREVFNLHKIENLTYEEIAEFLCISKKTIANHIYLASNFLKEECRKP